MAIEVLFLEEFEVWWDELNLAAQKSVALVVDMLMKEGVLLTFPYSSGIRGSTKLRELRIQHAGQPYRVLYAFDPSRNAVLLLGGNKAGDDRWYDKHVPRAEKLFTEYLADSGTIH